MHVHKHTHTLQESWTLLSRVIFYFGTMLNLHKICFKSVCILFAFPTLRISLFYRLGWELEDFFLFHLKSLRINANCILRYQGDFSSCAPTVFYCAHYHVLGVIFLIWVKPMQDINCISLLVLALLFNSGIYECSKRNTTDKQTAVYSSIDCSWGNE